MDDFVKKAFADAADSEKLAEAKAFDERITKNIVAISMACGVAVGLGEMEKLSRAVSGARVTDVLAEWTKMVMTIAFAEGYDAARMIEQQNLNCNE